MWAWILFGAALAVVDTACVPLRRRSAAAGQRAAEWVIRTLRRH